MVFPSCKKADPVVDPPFPYSRLWATVDGKSFQASEVTGSAGSSSLTVTGVLNSGTSKASSISLSIPNFSGTGNYAIPSDAGASYSEPGGPFDAESGTITLTTITTSRVEGKFSFVGKGAAGSTKTVTNGNFDFYK